MWFNLETNKLNKPAFELKYMFQIRDFVEIEVSK